MADSKGIRKPRSKKAPSGQLDLAAAVKKTEAAPKAKRTKGKTKIDGRVLNQVVFKFDDGREQLVKVGEAAIAEFKLKVADNAKVSVHGKSVSGGERHQTKEVYLSMGREKTKKGGLRQRWRPCQVPKSATFSDCLYWIMLSGNFAAKPGAIKYGSQEVTIDQKIRRRQLSK
jgi:hypothetical protein